MRFRAKKARYSTGQGYLKCGNRMVQTDGRTDGRSRDSNVTTKIFWLDR